MDLVLEGAIILEGLTLLHIGRPIDNANQRTILCVSSRAQKFAFVLSTEKATSVSIFIRQIIP